MNRQLLIILGAVALFGTAIFLFTMRHHHSKPSNEVLQQFKEWQVKYNKKYDDNSASYRLQVFASNLAKIQKSTGKTYTLGEN
jgi:hypothetical protein